MTHDIEVEHPHSQGHQPFQPEWCQLCGSFLHSPLGSVPTGRNHCTQHKPTDLPRLPQKTPPERLGCYGIMYDCIMSQSITWRNTDPHCASHYVLTCSQATFSRVWVVKMSTHSAFRHLQMLGSDIKASNALIVQLPMWLCQPWRPHTLIPWCCTVLVANKAWVASWKPTKWHVHVYIVRRDHSEPRTSVLSNYAMGTAGKKRRQTVCPWKFDPMVQESVHWKMDHFQRTETLV